MTPERWQRVKGLFTESNGLSASQRAELLARVRAEDAVLAAEVESLLAANDTADAIVDKPAAALLANDLPSEARDPWIGRQIGRYEITALIGYGGMGGVYRARRVDAAFEKEVAIKLVPGGFHASYVLQRLHAERQILANLEHPNIARLIDGGATDDGSPYLVMEFVDGVPIDRHAAEHRLGVRDRLGLFLEVCAAVGYAHQRLVVHRDLKPANILVTADGAVKLLDFGIAKLLQPAGAEAATAPTMTVMHALTPGYSSPEQILGRAITTASDVYSLGVVLYVLLTGRSPYGGRLDSAEDAIRAVCDTEPVRPSDTAPDDGAAPAGAIGRDLDAIILRALRKEPDRRYASVAQFADDIRRHLDGLPVTARGDQLGYRAGRFLRRHKIEATAALALFLTLVVATGYSLREARIADAERARAERHFASVRGFANTFMFRVHDAIENLPGSVKARELLVTTALEYLNALAAEAGEDTALRLELAAAYERVGNIQGRAHDSSLGDMPAALESYTKASALLQPIVAGEPGNAAAVRALAHVLVLQSRLLMLQGKLAEATAASKRAIGLLEPLASVQPGTESESALTAALLAHTDNLGYSGAPPAERQAYARRSIAMLEDRVREKPGDRVLAARLAVAYATLASVLPGSQPDPAALEEALALNRKSLAINERLVAETEGKETDHLRNLFTDRHNIARLLEVQEAYDEALAEIFAAKTILKALATDKDDSQVAIDAVVSNWHHGRILLSLGRVAEAREILEANLDTIDALEGQEDNLQIVYALAATESTLADIHGRLASGRGVNRAVEVQQWQFARDLYRRALPRFERVTSAATLDHIDMRAVNDARAGLARSEAEIAGLAGAVAGG